MAERVCENYPIILADFTLDFLQSKAACRFMVPFRTVLLVAQTLFFHTLFLIVHISPLRDRAYELLFSSHGSLYSPRSSFFATAVRVRMRSR